MAKSEYALRRLEQIRAEHALPVPLETVCHIPSRPTWAVPREYLLRPRTSGVYFLWNADELVYVGKSVDMLARIPGHFENRLFEWTHYTWIVVVPPEVQWNTVDQIALNDQLLAMEALYIDAYKPAGNRELDLKALRRAKELGLARDS